MFLKQKHIIIIVFVIAITAGIFFLFKNQSPKDISKITDKEIINLLEKNKDSLDYMERYKDFKIEKKISLTKESILEGQNAERFKEVYQDLSLEDNRYLRVDLINITGDKGLITVLDLKTREVPKVYGLILLKSGVKTK